MKAAPYTKAACVIALLGLALVNESVLAVTPTFGGSLTVTDHPGGSSTAASFNSNTLNFSQFDTNIGVLTGATFSQVLSLSDDVFATGGSNKNRSITGVTSLGANLTIAGSTATLAPTLTANANCSITGGSNCSSTSALATTTFSGTFGGPLSALAGTSYVGGSETLSISSTATKTGNVNQSLTYSRASATAGDISLTYSYLQHANASFSSAIDTNMLNIDFGMIQKGASATHSFSIFNLANPTATGLDFAGTSGIVSLSAFTNLSQGASQGGNVVFDSTGMQNGIHSGIVTLTFNDAAGIGVGQTSNTLALDWTATVVPEPETYSLLIAGLGLLTGVARRRKQIQ